MTQNYWTEKHDAYCLKHKLSPTAKLIWQWLIHTERPEEAEPDLKQFNQWATKHRGRPFHRDTLKIAWNQLIESDVIRPIKQFTWSIWRCAIRPINLLLYPISTPRKRSRIEETDRGSDGSNDSNAPSQDIAAAALSNNEEEIINECKSAGISFSDTRILRKFSLEKVRSAIALFFRRGGFALDLDGMPRIDNPQGFILDALRKGWIDEPENQGVTQHG